MRCVIIIMLIFAIFAGTAIGGESIDLRTKAKADYRDIITTEGTID